jgi:hypothetical protein
VSSVNGKTGAVVLTGIPTDVTGSLGAVRAWGVFNGGNPTAVSPYSRNGVSSITGFSYPGTFTVTLNSNPGGQAIIIASALNEASGAGNPSTYYYRAAGKNTSGNVVNIYTMTGGGAASNPDTIQFMIIW